MTLDDARMLGQKMAREDNIWKNPFEEKYLLTKSKEDFDLMNAWEDGVIDYTSFSWLEEKI